MLLTGEATPNVPVYAYRNDIQVGFVTAGGDGIYAISVSLVVGSNALKASTNNDCHTPSFSDTVTVERQAVEPPPSPEPEPTPETPSEPSEEPEDQTDEQQPPDVDAPSDQPERKRSPKERPPGEARPPVITQPQDGAVVHEPFVLVVGETSAHTKVQILRGDDVMAEVLSDDTGQFMARIPLNPGANRLMAAVGTLFSETVVVTYEPQSTSLFSRWLIPATVTSIVLAFGFTVFLVWQPVFARRILHTLRWWKHK